MEGNFFDWSFTGKFSYSINYGVYRTSSTGKIFDGGINPSTDNIFPKTKQLSVFLETQKELQKGIYVGVQGGFDIGDLFDNSFGILLMVSKLFN